MTQVIKKIKGHKYLYFQDSGKVDDRTKVISTCIGRADLTPYELKKCKQVAFTKHMMKLFKITALIKKTSYHFEHILTNIDDELEDELELVRLSFAVTLKNLTGQEIADFQKILFTKYVHGTTAIEGNTLTEDEVQKLLVANLTPSNKTVNESLEVSNYNLVKEYLESQSGSVDMKMIKKLHALLLNGLVTSIRLQDKPGQFRTSQVILKGIGYRPPPPEVVSHRITYLLNEYYSNIQKNIHPLDLASYFHQKFEEIHPFQDGNGRVGRGILNYMLKQSGYPEIYITMKHRSRYLDALQDGNAGNYDSLFMFIKLRIYATLDYLDANTSYFKKLFSPNMEQVYEKLGIPELYEDVKKETEDIKNTNELP